MSSFEILPKKIKENESIKRCKSLSINLDLLDNIDQMKNLGKNKHNINYPKNKIFVKIVTGHS